MSFKQGAVALVLAGILSGCVAPAAKRAPAADANACPDAALSRWPDGL